MSGLSQGAELDLSAVNGKLSGNEGIEHAAELVAFVEAVMSTDQARELLRKRDKTRRQIETRNMAAISIREIPRCTARTRTDIQHAPVRLKPNTLHHLNRRRPPANMKIVRTRDIGNTQALKRAMSSLKRAKNTRHEIVDGVVSCDKIVLFRHLRGLQR